VALERAAARARMPWPARAELDRAEADRAELERAELERAEPDRVAPERAEDLLVDLRAGGIASPC
jgi:hypothetical protein